MKAISQRSVEDHAGSENTARSLEYMYSTLFIVRLTGREVEREQASGWMSQRCRRLPSCLSLALQSCLGFRT
jgi:hypothetical protein